jgi:hypothetical protein
MRLPRLYLTAILGILILPVNGGSAVQRRAVSAQFSSSEGWDGPGRGSATLTYYIAPPPNNHTDEVEVAIEGALRVISEVAYVTFRRTSQPGQPRSIDFTWGSIDGPGGVLAKARPPSDLQPEPLAGDVQFDLAETWEVGNAKGGLAFDLLFAFVHETLHALGLEHSAEPGSVMASTVSPEDSFQSLSKGDVESILRLYAPARRK